MRLNCAILSIKWDEYAQLPIVIVQYCDEYAGILCPPHLALRGPPASQVGVGGPKCHNNREIIHYPSPACSKCHIDEEIIHYLSVVEFSINLNQVLLLSHFELFFIL